MLGHLLLSLSGFVIYQVTAQDDGELLEPGETIRCAKWFPEDPCFWRATYMTDKCLKPYKWKRDVHAIEATADNESLTLAALDNIVVMHHTALVIDHELMTDEQLNTENNPNVVFVSSKLSQNTSLDIITKPIDLSPNPPCCHFSMACYNFMASLPKGTKLGDNRENYHKWVCCLTSWAMGCGSKVPDIPATIREPPKCTMPKGHDPWATKQ